jgi:hypothetical protein
MDKERGRESATLAERIGAKEKPKAESEGQDRGLARVRLMRGEHGEDRGLAPCG